MNETKKPIEIVHVPSNKLKMNPENPRKIGIKEFESLVKSLTDCPQMFEARPLLVSPRTGELVIIGGNMRFKAAKKLKYTAMPCVILDGITEEQEREIAIKDNGAWGEWDWDLLANKFSELPLTDWGINLPEDWLGEPQDIKEVVSFVESVNFIIGCKDLDDFKKIQQVFGIETKGMNFEEFIAWAENHNLVPHE